LSPDLAVGGYTSLVLLAAVMLGLCVLVRPPKSLCCFGLPDQRDNDSLGASALLGGGAGMMVPINFGKGFITFKPYRPLVFLP
jgi:hypothetical protein